MAKVMVVDDAYSELKLMESILRGAGHDVVTLIDGDALEDKVTAERPDVLLLDIVMPKRNAATRGTPIVLVSSKNQESDRAWGLRRGDGRAQDRRFSGQSGPPCSRAGQR